jgi:hypothetical protein
MYLRGSFYEKEAIDAIKVLALFKAEQNAFIPKIRFDEINQKKKELEWQVMHQKSQVDEMRGNSLINQKLKEEMLKLLWQAGQDKKKEEERYKELFIYSMLSEMLSSYKYAELIFEKMNTSWGIGRSTESTKAYQELFH